MRVEYKIIPPNPLRNPERRPVLHMPQDPSDLLTKDRLGKEVLAPGLDRPLPQVVISRADYKKSPGNPTYLIGVVAYDDIFEKPAEETKSPRHITKFCYQIGQVGSKSYQGIFASVLNTVDTIVLDLPWFKPNFDLCPYWNCADETCQPDREDYHKDLDAAFEKAEGYRCHRKPECA